MRVTAEQHLTQRPERIPPFTPTTKQKRLVQPLQIENDTRKGRNTKMQAHHEQKDNANRNENRRPGGK